ncbi:MAG TPA: hypothetical protein VKB39_06655, partial [Candidatus Baltobacteraceae bacterium]|nr:hypothetical protein [Candidatus Baltobacteraceae bacterium]
IPAHRHHPRGRRMNPQYVSPGTASITFAVQPIASSKPAPTPMPLQKFDTTAPNCQPIARSGGVLMCQFSVSVMPGSDSFVVNTYSGTNGRGKLLSTYTSTGTVMPTPDPKGRTAPLAFTLEGVIDHVVLQFPNSVVPADTQGQAAAIPVGVATSEPLDVTPYDAKNYQILSQVPAKGTPVPYSAPITLSIAPTGKGFTLSNASSSGNSVTISNPNDLAVNIDYSGAFTASGGSVSSTTSFSIAATGSTLALRARKLDLRAPLAATPAPNAAGIELAGNSIPAGIYTTTLTSPSPAGLVSTSTGAMAFLGSGYNASLVYTAIVGTATGGVPSGSGELAGSNFSGMFADSLGNLWTFDNNAYQIDCFSKSDLTTPAGTIPSSTIFSGQSFSYFAGFTEDSSNNLWFVVYGYLSAGGGFETIGYVPVNSTTCASPAPVLFQTSSPTGYPNASSVAAIPGAASVTIGAYDPTVGNAIQIAATSPPTSPPAPTVSLVPAAGEPQALFGGPTTYAFVGGALGTVSPAGAFSSITSYPTDLATFVTTSTSTAQSASGVLGTTVYNGNFGPYNFVTLLNPADTNASTNLEAIVPAPYCNGIVFDAADTAWTFCTNSQGNLQFFHIVPTSTWSLIPSTTVPVAISGCLAPFSGSSYVGVLEAFGSTAGPFKLKHYNTSVISAVKQEGGRGMSFTVTEPAAGSYVETADVVDNNGRTVPVTLDITASAQACAPPRPPMRGAPRRNPHARRGYPPIPRS